MRLIIVAVPALSVSYRFVPPLAQFSSWLHSTEASLNADSPGAQVPCGECRGCCRSSMFIHIRPEEKETLARIPKALLFKAPGQPKGHKLLGYNDRGECPLFVDNACSIYEHRPQTCRDYDCRIFAATGIPIDPETQPEIAQRVSEWKFRHASEKSRTEQAALRRAAAFLQKNRGLFPPGALPTNPGALAALAVRLFRLFAKPPAKPKAVTVQAIMSELQRR